MTATGQHRGHGIYWCRETNVWRYVSDNIAVQHDRNRACGACQLPNTPEGHDGCIGTLPNVKNACCGHGSIREAYVQFNDNHRIEGQAAIDFMEAHK